MPALTVCVPLNDPPPGSDDEKAGHEVVVVLILIPAFVIGFPLVSCAKTVTVSTDGKVMFQVVFEFGATNPADEAA
jgi:hypothetical protein